MITYIGSKHKHISEISKLVDISASMKILDLFSGSGACSNYFSKLTYTDSVDIEYFSTVLTSYLYLKFDKYKNDALISNIKRWYYELDDTVPCFFRHNYSPDINGNFTRLFFTYENALSLDKMHFIYHDLLVDEYDKIIIGFEIIKHIINTVNSSAGMKSFYPTLGGNSKIRIDSILKCFNIDFYIPETSSNYGNSICSDSNAFLQSCPYYDLIFIDPPSDTHQYSSNYHLLNLFFKKAIPSDYLTNTGGYSKNLYSSPYSKKTTALNELYNTICLASSKTEHIILTYPKQGILTFEQLFLCCSQESKNIVTVHILNEYLYCFDIYTNKYQTIPDFHLFNFSDIYYLNKYNLPVNWKIQKLKTCHDIFDEFNKLMYRTDIYGRLIHRSIESNNKNFNIFLRFNDIFQLYLTERKWSDLKKLIKSSNMIHSSNIHNNYLNTYNFIKDTYGF